MPERPISEDPVGGDWHSLILQDFRKILADRPWSRDIFLRGSLARGTEDPESDIDLAVTVADDKFEAALDDLSHALPPALGGRLPPWLDGLVRDFGGIGLVYLLQVAERKWGQVDIYLLPHGRRHRLLEHEPTTLSLLAPDVPGRTRDLTESHVDAVRRSHEQLAAQDLQQAVLACYVATFLLRKRLIRRDRLQTFADTYATAKCVRDLIVLACYPDRREHGWHGLPKVAERSQDPALVLDVLSTFTRQDVLQQPAELSSRVSALEEIVPPMSCRSRPRSAGSWARSPARYAWGATTASWKRWPSMPSWRVAGWSRRSSETRMPGAR
jgi:predicted nucleotidyltransferase